MSKLCYRAKLTKIGSFFPFPCIRGLLHLCSMFRVVPAAVYLDNFVSDRSHMVRRTAHKFVTRKIILGIAHPCPFLSTAGPGL